MRGLGGAAALGAVLLFAGIATAAASEANVTIEVLEDGNVSVEDPEHLVEDTTLAPPDTYAWRLNLTDGYQTARVHVEEGFPIERARQLVPLQDDRHFVEVRDTSDLDRPARVFNLTDTSEGWTYSLGMLGPGGTNLTLHRDLAAPEIEIASVGNVSHIGFDVVTNTTEIATAQLLVYNASGAQIQTYPTPRPGPWQKFPVQGLDADTTYGFDVRAWDWSGNEVMTPRREVTTAPAPNPPEPIVEPISPEPNTTVSPDEVLVQASFEANGSAVLEDEIVLFFDKERVDREDFEVEDGKITYRPPGPLGERAYFVGIEVPNEAGGTGVARWSFESQVPRSAPSPVGPGLLAATVAAVAIGLAPRRLEGPRG